jgi:O-antigen/teichoic acid export membrane protein
LHYSGGTQGLAATAPLYGEYARVIGLAALSVPVIALTNVYLGATRGLGQMSQTLYVFWIGQPLVWIGVAGAAIAAGGATDSAVVAWDVSWLAAAIAARTLWRRAAAGYAERPASREEVRSALRYGLPRAPAALLAQAMFWADLWVLAAFESGTELDAYSAAARISQVLLLFLTSVSLVFSPFAADLHARGERQRLDALFKRSTRWALAATLPLLIVLFVAADDVLRAFSPRFAVGEDALRILLAGQALNVATGSVGFILINPGGLTQHGVSLHDAIKAMPFPVIEVHITNIAAREAWRDHSIISPAAKGTVQGLGWRSYTAALRALVEIVQDGKK